MFDFCLSFCLATFHILAETATHGSETVTFMQLCAKQCTAKQLTASWNHQYSESWVMTSMHGADNSEAYGPLIGLQILWSFCQDRAAQLQALQKDVSRQVVLVQL